MMVILIKTRRHIGLVVSVHHGIHHQLTQCFIWVIQYIFLSQNTYCHRAFGDNAVADKVLQLRQYLIQSTFESALVHYFSAVIVPFETYVLDIRSRHKETRPEAEHYKCGISRTVPLQIKKVQCCQLFFYRTCVVRQDFSVYRLWQIIFDDDIHVDIFQFGLPAGTSVKGWQTGGTSFGKDAFLFGTGYVSTRTNTDKCPSSVAYRCIERWCYLDHKNVPLIRHHFFGTHHWQGKYIAIGSYSAYFLHQCIVHLQPTYVPVVIYAYQQISLLPGAWHIIGKSAYRFLKLIHIAC